MKLVAVSQAAVHQYRLVPTERQPDEVEDGAADGPARRATAKSPLSYTVELWDEGKASVEQVLAMTAHGSIGFAAYYAATREYPHRYITLRHRNEIVSRWNGPGH
jgi:hypothetical protein